MRSMIVMLLARKTPTTGFLPSAALARASLLGLEFTVGCCGEGWKLAGVSGMPDLREGGDALLDALASVMRNG